MTLKINKVGVLGCEKRRKALAGHELDKEFLKYEVGETSYLERRIFLWRMDDLLIK